MENLFNCIWPVVLLMHDGGILLENMVLKIIGLALDTEFSECLDSTQGIPVH
jgi:hypothetical protein